MRIFVRIGYLLGLLLVITSCGEADPLLQVTRAGVDLPTPETAEPPIGINLVTLAPPTAVVLQITPSPLPPPTATPTATPIVHIIDEGDTLLQLAIDNRTTVADIEALNPGINARLLSIGQQVVLPPPATPIFSGELATAVPTELEIGALSFYKTPLGSLWILGEVANEGIYPAENIRLELTLIGVNGLSLGQAAVWTVPTVVLPQQTAPFGLLLSNPPEGVEQIQGAIVQSNTLPEQPPRTGGLSIAYEVRSVELKESAASESQLSIRGEVVNTAAVPVARTMVVATLYDTRGRVIGYSQLQLDGTLPAGGAVPFEMAAAPPGGTAVDVSFNVQGVFAAE